MIPADVKRRNNVLALAGVVAILAMGVAIYIDAGTYGPIAAVVAVVVLVALRVQLMRRPTRLIPTYDQVHVGDSSAAPQIVGTKCVHCGGKISSVIDAAPCKLCKR